MSIIHKGNGQVESTNKFFSMLIMKLVSENQDDWDEHMSTILLSYIIAFKVGVATLALGLQPRL